ncbi:MAG: Lysozyme [Streptosporangiaceae bacterium]|nr:Lysozyme [Streptosporangiaceae bacterium]
MRLSPRQQEPAPSHPSRPTGRARRNLRRLTSAAVVAALTGGALMAGPAAGAAPYPSDPSGPTRVSGPVTHPEMDYAGSTIAGHEGAKPGVMLAPGGLPGLDVSGYQGNVDWNAVRANGATFAYVKATEGTGYTNPYFSQQYVGSYNVGLVRGAYHFALPDRSSGAAQANYLAGHGGGWSADNRTLPAALDIEYNPYGATCYGLSQSAMRSWIADFINTYRARTGRWATIYTTTDWWKSCTGNYSGFAANNPLWIARYAGSVGELPAGWGVHTFWQWASQPGTFPGDQDVFNGSSSRLVALANNT